MAKRSAVAGLPAILFLTAFFVGPVLALLVRSFADPTWGVQNYEQLAENSVYAEVFVNTLYISLLVTLTTLLVSFPLAWFLVIAGRRISKLVMGIVVLSMWTSGLARLFALLVLLQDTGAINHLLLSTGLISHPLPLVNNLIGVLIGMTYVMLPFMTLSIHATLSAIDPALMRASSICGAGPIRTFFKVLLPLASPGITTGCTLVFVTTLGYYVAPEMLGGPHQLMIAQLIIQQVQMFLNWGLGSAAAFVILLITLAIYGLYLRLVDNTARSRL